MINALFDHIARYKAGYIAIAVAAVLGISVWGYNRIPDFEALELAGRTGRLRGVPIQVLSPNGGETLLAGQALSVRWGIGQPAPSVVPNQRAVPPTVDIYLRTAGPGSGVLSGERITQPRRGAIEVGRNLTGVSFNYTLPQDLVGQWKVIILNKRLQSIDESDNAFTIERYVAPEPEETREADTAAPVEPAPATEPTPVPQPPSGPQPTEPVPALPTPPTEPVPPPESMSSTLPLPVSSLEIRRVDDPGSRCTAVQPGGLRQVARYRLRATGEAMRVSAISIINDLAGAFDAPTNTAVARDAWLINDEGHDWGQTLVNGFATPQFVADVPVGTDVYMNVHTRVVTADEYGPGLNGQIFRLGVYETVTPAYANGINVVGAASGRRYQIGDGVTVVNGDPAPCSVVAPVTIGTLTIREQNSPRSSIVVAGRDRYLVAQYQLAAQREAFNVNELTVINDLTGAFDAPVDTMAVERVTLEYADRNGVAQTASSPLAGGVGNYSGLTPALYVPADSTAILKIYADISPAEYGMGLSGQTLKLGLKENNPESADGTFRATGLTSGSAIYNPAISGSANVNRHIVRFTVPTVTRWGGDESLNDGTRDLYKISITADPAFHVLLVKRIVFRVRANMNAGDSISNFRISELGGNDLLATEVAITANGINLLNTTANFANLDGDGNGQFEGSVVVTFAYPQRFAPGAIKTFVLKADVSGASMTDIVAAYIPDDTSPASSERVSDVLGASPNFVWSDGSSGSAYESEPGPWINGYLVDTLPTPAITLSY